jgi:site-specific DNA-methyltransferase (adenine-specific)
MGKKWDYNVPSIDIWKECLRVLKPGGTMLCFAGSRTQHRMAINIEDAGFLIKDCLIWIYGSGFPKSLNIGKAIDKLQGNEREELNEIERAGFIRKGRTDEEIFLGGNPIISERKKTIGHSDFEGYGTALKPAYEPIIMAMKPNDGSYAENALKWGVSGINIDESRIETEESTERPTGLKVNTFSMNKERGRTSGVPAGTGRFPANILFDEEAAKMLDEQTGILKSGQLNPYKRISSDYYSGSWPDSNFCSNKSQGGASRFFYCAKASKSERNEGCEKLEEKEGIRTNAPRENEFVKTPKLKNNHPTVKPLKLMEYLIKLIMPPKDGLILDPFAGSGSTILAAKRLGYNAIGIELDEEYCKIARARISSIVKEKENQQMDLFNGSFQS